MKLILLFILFYLVFKLVQLFIVNFRLGAGKNNNYHKENRSKSKYEDVEETDFTEIESKEKKPQK